LDWSLWRWGWTENVSENEMRGGEWDLPERGHAKNRRGWVGDPGRYAEDTRDERGEVK
jgi:hypothetical protein